MVKIGVAVMLVFVLTACISTVHYDGELQPVAPVLSVTIRGSEPWHAAPSLASRSDEPNAIYVVVPAVPNGNRFAAIRIDSRGATQQPATVALGPRQPYKAFAAAEAEARVHGVRFERPAFHGAGVHRVDSATGGVEIVCDDRVLLTRSAFNSSSTAEVLSRVFSDRDRRWIVALDRGRDGWKLFLFERRPAFTIGKVGL